MRQLLTESLVLSAIGGALGVGLAWMGIDARRGTRIDPMVALRAD